MWLLRLYPRSWRERYGDEMAELLRNESWSPSLVVDVISGAVDARLNPQRASFASENRPLRAEENGTMLSKVLQLRCAGSGPQVSARDQRWGNAVMLGSTLVLTGLWLWAFRTYRQPEVHDYLFSFLQGTYLAGLILAMPFGSLKGRSRATQAVMMGSAFVALIAWCLLVGFVASKI